MKVVLLGEIKGKGGEGDVVDVAQGYAENYLFPKKLAVAATKGNLKQLEERRNNIEKREAVRIADANTLKETLEGKSVVGRRQGWRRGRPVWFRHLCHDRRCGQGPAWR